MRHDRRASAIYVNTFSGEATTQLPTEIQMARGGVYLCSVPLFLFQFDFHSEMSMSVIDSPSLWDNSTKPICTVQLNMDIFRFEEVTRQFSV